MNLYEDNRTRRSASRGKSQSGRSGYTGSRNSRSSAGAKRSSGGSGRGRRRNSRKDYTKVAIVGVIAIILILVIALWAKGCGGDKVQEETALEESLEKNVTVDGVSVTGMSREQAKEAIMANYAWSMKISYEGEEYEMENLIEERVEQLLDEIFSTQEPQETYSLDVTGMEELISAQAAAAAEKWDKPAKNGEISGFDKEKGTFIYSGEEKGLVIDQEKLISDITAKLAAKEFDAVIEAVGVEQDPEITEAEAKEMYQVIGQYSTTTTANKARNTNIKLASETLEGLIIQPGEEFSFNDTTGPRSESKGYQPAGAYLDGKLVEEPGGGVCQVSSTLYNAVVFAGLKTTERHAHSFEPSYVTPGEDAAVSYGGPDMKFVNNSDTAIALRAKLEGSLSGKIKLTISVVGIPILEEGVTYSMHSEKVAELDPPAPEYQDDQTLPPHTEKVIKEATNGSRWTTNLVIKKNGEVISDERLHNSTYLGHAAVIKRNDTDTQVTTEGTGETVESLNPDMTIPTVDGSTVEVSNGASSSTSGPGGEASTSASQTVPETTAPQISAPASETQPSESSQESSQNVIAPHPGQENGNVPGTT